MADLIPFFGLIPGKGLAARTAALPYDVYGREEAAREAAKDPLSFLNIDRPETQFPPEQDMYAPEVYRKADEMLRRQIAQGVYIQDPKRCYYLYELTMDGRSQTGLVACASIDDYETGVIRRHENTRAEKEEDRVRHIDVCSAQTGPIFLACRRNARITEAAARAKAEEPVFDFISSDGIRHRGWRISGEAEIQEIREGFAKMERLYIADGHHRAASAVRVGKMRHRQYPDYNGSEEFNYFLSVIFPEDELKIMDYNRVVRDRNGLSPEEFLNRAAQVCEITLLDGAARPQEKGCMTMYLAAAASPSSCAAQNAESRTASQNFAAEPDAGKAASQNFAAEPDAGKAASQNFAAEPDAGKAASQNCATGVREDGTAPSGGLWYRLCIRDEFRSQDPVEGLDVEILQRQILAPVLGIGDPKTDERISFVGGIRGLAELKKRADRSGGVAFAMYPTSMAELLAVADAGRLMPPKSTWFEPKLRSGLFLHRIEGKAD